MQIHLVHGTCQRCIAPATRRLASRPIESMSLTIIRYQHHGMMLYWEGFPRTHNITAAWAVDREVVDPMAPQWDPMAPHGPPMDCPWGPWAAHGRPWPPHGPPWVARGLPWAPPSSRKCCRLSVCPNHWFLHQDLCFWNSFAGRTGPAEVVARSVVRSPTSTRAGGQDDGSYTNSFKFCS